MWLEKRMIDKMGGKGGDLVMEVKGKERRVGYGIEENVEVGEGVDVYWEGGLVEDGRIERRVWGMFGGNEVIGEREKWNGDVRVVEIGSGRERKCEGEKSWERRLYVWSV